MLSQEERTRRSRRTIVDAALRIIGEEGYRAMTTTRIEEVAGVSRGLVGYHFGSMRGLTEAVVRHVGDRFFEDVIAPQAEQRSTGIEGVLALIGGYLGQLGEDPRPSRAMLILIVESFVGQPDLRDAVRDLNGVLRDSLRDQLLRGQGDGSVRGDVDPTVESVLLAGILRGIAVQWLADPDGVDLGRAADRAVAVASHAYAGYRPTA
jgi:AcrR family transcriptional regulator